MWDQEWWIYVSDDDMQRSIACKSYLLKAQWLLRVPNQFKVKKNMRSAHRLF